MNKRDGWKAIKYMKSHPMTEWKFQHGAILGISVWLTTFALTVCVCNVRDVLLECNQDAWIGCLMWGALTVAFGSVWWYSLSPQKEED